MELREIFEKKVAAFKAELSEMLKKHHITVHSADDYDGEDNYAGTTLYFKIEEEVLFDETVEKILKENANG